jgi:hypothetical protein
MNIISEYGLYIVLVVVALIWITLYLYNFFTILSFKWHLDYYKSKDSACESSVGSKLENETLRHNIYSFLFQNEDNDIHISIFSKNFDTSFYLFILYYSIIIIGIVGYSFVYQQYFDISFYVFILIIYITYTTTNSLIVQNFNDIQEHAKNKENNISIYFNLYKILNAIILIGNVQDVPMEYSHDKLNYKILTFDEILEKNISSSENVANTSTVLQLKSKAIKRLDFAKYFTFDMSSPFFIKYFENIYIRLPESSTNTFDISENIYLRDIHLNRNKSVNYNNIRKHFDKMSQILKQESRDTYININKKISQEYPIDSNDLNEEYKKMKDFISSVQTLLDNDIKIKQYDNVLYNEVENILLSIQMILRNHQYNHVYENINNLIKNKLEMNNVKLEIPNNDFIEYYLNNIDIIINENSQDNNFDDVLKLMTYQGHFIYSYMVYWIIILLLISHYSYVSLNGIYHSMWMCIVITIYIMFFYVSSLSKFSGN